MIIYKLIQAEVHKPVRMGSDHVGWVYVTTDNQGPSYTPYYQYDGWMSEAELVQSVRQLGQLQGRGNEK